MQSKVGKTDNRDEEVYQQAMQAWEQGNHESALNCLSALIANSSLNSGMLYNLRANVYKECGHTEEALTDFKKSIALSPRTQLASSTYFHFLVDNRWFAEAREEGLRYISTLNDDSQEDPSKQNYLQAIRSVLSCSVSELERIYAKKQ